MPSPVRTLALTLMAASAISFPAFADFSAAELTQDNALLNQFNLVTLGNFSQSSTAASTAIQGRALVGGNASFGVGATVNSVNSAGNTTAATDGTGLNYGALTVFGNMVASTSTSTGATTFLSIGSGAADIRGTATGNVLLNSASGSTSGVLNIVGSASSMNVGNATAMRTSQSTFAGGNYTFNTSTGQVTGYGPMPQVGLAMSSVFPFGVSYSGTQVTALAQGIANLPGMPGVSAQILPSGDGVFFTANNDYTRTVGGTTYRYGVVTTTLANLASETNFGGINNGTNDATLVIVRGDGANFTLPNLNTYAGSDKVIFDFVDATTLRFAGNWNGSVLSPMANVTQQGGLINGSVVVASMNQSNALNNSSLFDGDLSGLAGFSIVVPEPASLTLVGVSMGMLVATAYRRRSHR